MFNTPFHEKLDRLARGGAGPSLKHLADVVDHRLREILEEIQCLTPAAPSSGSETAADPDLQQACEFLACGVEPKACGFVKSHRWTQPLQAAGCKSLHDIAAHGPPAAACEHIWAHWPESTHHERPSRRCLEIVCVAAHHIVSQHPGP